MRLTDDKIIERMAEAKREIEEIEYIEENDAHGLSAEQRKRLSRVYDKMSRYHREIERRKPAPACLPPKKSPYNWQVGQNVDDPEYGKGVITKVEIDGGFVDRVQVNFANAGMKWLAPAYSDMRPV